MPLAIDLSTCSLSVWGLASVPPAAPATVDAFDAYNDGVSEQKTELTTFGAGCFWGVEEDFRQIPGVVRTLVGYEGGHTANPTYEQVCSHRTGHAEVVQVEFDPSVVSYETLVDAFFELHNPTTLNAQGPDIGDQYRSAIFFHSPEQEAVALATKDRLTAEKHFSRPIVTEVTPSSGFNVAEDYHQQYLAKRGRSSCRI